MDSSLAKTRRILSSEIRWIEIDSHLNVFSFKKCRKKTSSSPWSWLIVLHSGHWNSQWTVAKHGWILHFQSLFLLVEYFSVFSLAGVFLLAYQIQHILFNKFLRLPHPLLSSPTKCHWWYVRWQKCTWSNVFDDTIWLNEVFTENQAHQSDWGSQRSFFALASISRYKKNKHREIQM